MIIHFYKLYFKNESKADCLFAINILSRYTRSPTLHDIKSIDRVIECITSTPVVVLYGSADASFSNHDDR